MEGTDYLAVAVFNYVLCDHCMSNAPICICGDQMKPRRGTAGWFYGCSNYPQCDHTEPMEDDCEDDEL